MHCNWPWQACKFNFQQLQRSKSVSKVYALHFLTAPEPPPPLFSPVEPPERPPPPDPPADPLELLLTTPELTFRAAADCARDPKLPCGVTPPLCLQVADWILEAASGVMCLSLPILLGDGSRRRVPGPGGERRWRNGRRCGCSGSQASPMCAR